MSGLQPLPDDLRALLAAEREAEGVSPALQASLARRLSVSLAAGMSAADGGGDVAPNASTAMQWLLQKPIVAALVFGAGAAIGSAATVGIQSSRPERTPAAIVRAPEPIVVQPKAAPAPIPAPSEPSVTTSPPVVAERAPAVRTRSSTETDLRSERQWVDRARSALARDRAADALIALAAHERRYPNGQLAEERASLQIVALVRVGRVGEAEGAAERFRARYPNSLFAGLVDQAFLQVR